jgi:choline kinase
LLDRQLDTFAAAGIDDVTVVAGFMAESVLRHVANRCRVVVNEQYATTNSITSLNLAASHLRGHGFVLQNADVLYDAALVRRLLAAPHCNCCLVDSVRSYQPGEYHVETIDGRITRYSNMLPEERSVGVSAQLLRVGAGDSEAFMDRIAMLVSSGGAGGFPNQAYDVLMDGDGLWPVFTASLPWWEIDTADDLARCNADNVVRPTTTAIREPVPARPPLAARAASFLRSPHLPATLDWARPIVAPFCRNPLAVGRSVRAFQAGKLSFGGLDLAANGPAFLRMVLSEARTTGMEPFVLWGTLLGCIREGGFITGDHDIDLGVMHTDAHRLPGLRDRMKRHGFEVRIENVSKLSLVHPLHPRLYIDIDVVRPHRDGWVITSYGRDSRTRLHYHFEAGVFANVKSATFTRAMTVRVPDDAEGFLTAVYGNWRIPSPKLDYRYGPLNTEVELLPSTEPLAEVSWLPHDNDALRGSPDPSKSECNPRASVSV